MLYIGLQIRRQGPDVRVQEQDQRQGSDHTGQRAGTRIQDQDEQQPEQEQVRYSAPEQLTGPDSTEQITGPGYRTGYMDQMMQQGQDQTRQRTGTEGYRTGYNAVHRSDADTDANATGCRTRYR